MFSCQFYKGIQLYYFLFASLKDEAVLERALLLKDFAHAEEVTPIEKGGK